MFKSWEGTVVVVGGYVDSTSHYNRRSQQWSLLYTSKMLHNHDFMPFSFFPYHILRVEHRQLPGTLEEGCSDGDQ
jgi:hypothetical protein